MLRTSTSLTRVARSRRTAAIVAATSGSSVGETRAAAGAAVDVATDVEVGEGVPLLPLQASAANKATAMLPQTVSPKFTPLRTRRILQKFPG